MSLLDHHRKLYEYEKDCNTKMLTMLESVPEAARGDARFQRAVTIAGHLAACRENWLLCMAGEDGKQVAWWDEQCDLATLRARFADIEQRWAGYLARLDAEGYAKDFEFPIDDGQTFELPVAVQIVQLEGHAAYHRGQVALLADQLGGETVDTDYADWWWTLYADDRVTG